MLYKGENNTPLSLDQIQYLHSVLAGKPTTLLNPYALHKYLHQAPYINDFNKQRLSFQHLKHYFQLISSGKLHTSLPHYTPHYTLTALLTGQKIEAKKHNILYIRTKRVSYIQQQSINDSRRIQSPMRRRRQQQ